MGIGSDLREQAWMDAEIDQMNQERDEREQLFKSLRANIMQANTLSEIKTNLLILANLIEKDV